MYLRSTPRRNKDGSEVRYLQLAPLPDGTMQITAPGQAAGLIDQLRTAGITLTYDPDTRTTPATARRSP